VSDKKRAKAVTHSACSSLERHTDRVKYSGGLGNVAGDQLKANSDLGVPVVGVGLLYQQGYFRQVIDKDGAQEPLYPYNDPGQMPIAPPLAISNRRWQVSG
jgi:glycogen phosphorylase